MSESVLTLRLELRHDVRHQRTDIDEIEEGLVAYIVQQPVNNAAIELHPDTSAELENVESGLGTRIAVGHTASGLFLELPGKQRFGKRDLERLVQHVEEYLDPRYAPNVEVRGWSIQACKEGQYV